MSSTTANSKRKQAKQLGAAPDADPSSVRASGKRIRRQYNPNAWEKSIPTLRSNILCLGMSYPCVPKVLHNYALNRNVLLNHPEPSVEQAIELVRRGIVSEIDGRDLARVKALEANNDLLAYTVSKEEGAIYDEKKHLHGDFNRRTLVMQMKIRWGINIKFKQVILDYYWSPSGSWAMKHWQRSLFNDNIPDLVKENMLNFGDLETDVVHVSAKGRNIDEDYVSSTSAVVYLPFSQHCFAQVVACLDNLSEVFTISFLRKDELEEHSLWKATNTISAKSMQDWLGKSIDQEEKYCTLTRSQLNQDDKYVLGEEVLSVFDRIEDSPSVRMIKLTALRKFHPRYESGKKSANPILGIDKGGIYLNGMNDFHLEATVAEGFPRGWVTRMIPRKIGTRQEKFFYSPKHYKFRSRADALKFVDDVVAAGGDEEEAVLLFKESRLEAFIEKSKAEKSAVAVARGTAGVDKDKKDTNKSRIKANTDSADAKTDISFPTHASKFVRNLVTMLTENNNNAIVFTDLGRIEIVNREHLETILPKYSLGGTEATVQSFLSVLRSYGFSNRNVGSDVYWNASVTSSDINSLCRLRTVARGTTERFQDEANEKASSTSIPDRASKFVRNLVKLLTDGNDETVVFSEVGAIQIINQQKLAEILPEYDGLGGPKATVEAFKYYLAGYGFKSFGSGSGTFLNANITSNDIRKLCRLKYGGGISKEESATSGAKSANNTKGNVTTVDSIFDPFPGQLLRMLTSNNEDIIVFNRGRIEILDHAKLVGVLPKYIERDESSWDSFHQQLMCHGFFENRAPRKWTFYNAAVKTVNDIATLCRDSSVMKEINLINRQCVSDVKSVPSHFKTGTAENPAKNTEVEEVRETLVERIATSEGAMLDQASIETKVASSPPASPSTQRISPRRSDDKKVVEEHRETVLRSGAKKVDEGGRVSLIDRTTTTEGALLDQPLIESNDESSPATALSTQMRTFSRKEAVNISEYKWATDASVTKRRLAEVVGENEANAMLTTKQLSSSKKKAKNAAAAADVEDASASVNMSKTKIVEELATVEKPSQSENREEANASVAPFAKQGEDILATDKIATNASHSPHSGTMAAEKDTTLLKNISGSSSSETFNTTLPSPDKGRAPLPKNPQPLIPDDASPFIRSLVSMLVDNNEEVIEFSNNGRIEIKNNEKLAKILAKYKLGGKNARVGSFRRTLCHFGFRILDEDASSSTLNHEAILSSDLAKLCRLKMGGKLPESTNTLIPNDTPPFIRNLASMLKDNKQDAIVLSDTGRLEIRDSKTLKRLLAKYKWGSNKNSVKGFTTGLHGYGFRNLTPDSNNCVFYNDKIMSSDINVLCNLRWGRDIPFSSILFNILSDSNNEAAISFKRHRIEITDNAKLLELLPKYLAGDGSLWDMFHRLLLFYGFTEHKAPRIWAFYRSDVITLQDVESVRPKAEATPRSKGSAANTKAMEAKGGDEVRETRYQRSSSVDEAMLEGFSNHLYAFMMASSDAIPQTQDQQLDTGIAVEPDSAGLDSQQVQEDAVQEPEQTQVNLSEEDVPEAPGLTNEAVDLLEAHYDRPGILEEATLAQTEANFQLADQAQQVIQEGPSGALKDAALSAAHLREETTKRNEGGIGSLDEHRITTPAASDEIVLSQAEQQTNAARPNAVDEQGILRRASIAVPEVVIPKEVNVSEATTPELQEMAKNDGSSTTSKETEATPTYADLNRCIPGVNDVLLDPEHNAHPGNMRLQEAFNAVSPSNLNCCSTILQAIKSTNPPGRVLEKDSERGIWVDVTDEKAIIMIQTMMTFGVGGRAASTIFRQSDGSAFTAARSQRNDDVTRNSTEYGNHRGDDHSESTTQLTAENVPIRTVAEWLASTKLWNERSYASLFSRLANEAVLPQPKSHDVSENILAAEEAFRHLQNKSKFSVSALVTLMFEEEIRLRQASL
ncbi:predicted protein [Thalassiosira pseudonana CCMP1335]|uniref:MBD domain-containing protein n=1 Tax=Thalassiosira pseudonana TaxID=35128 RepID=B8C2V3_THAPS|nr:predicted protein [Thalassiosira pseudonana CCMP1335]EED92450.1 predicted protein [Thalassiosira pseudonana CCMP1335]